MKSLLNETSVIIVTYNNKNQIKDCLVSVLSEKPSEIIVVDNNSNDGTPDLIKKLFPQVKLIYNPKNGGYSRGINIGVENTKKEYLIVLNPDTKVKEKCFDALLRPLYNSKAVLTVPKTLFYDESKINTCGNIEHFTGLAFTRNLNGHSDSFNDCKSISGLSGVCFAIKNEDYIKLGKFDETFFLYMEDVDFSWRINSRGLKISYIPTAIVCHDYKLNVNPKKIYYLEKGRYMILRKYLTYKEYLIFAPSLLITEILTLGYSILNGKKGLKFKLKAIKDGLTMEVHKEVSNVKNLIKYLDWEIPEDQLSYTKLDVILKKIANKIYCLNYKIYFKGH